MSKPMRWLKGKTAHKIMRPGASVRALGTAARLVLRLLLGRRHISASAALPLSTAATWSRRRMARTIDFT
jgi:hypothetical protein